MWRLLLIFLPFCLSSCLYKAPTDDHLCTSPHTNNPLLTREQPQNMMPQG